EELHVARRSAYGVCAALTSRGRSARCCSRSRSTGIGSYDCTSRRRPGWVGRARVSRVSASTRDELAPMRHVLVALMVAAGLAVASLVFADGSGDPAGVKNEDGKYYDKEGNPTFKVQSDGTVDCSAAITPIAMSVMVPTARDRVMRPRSAIP